MSQPNSFSCYQINVGSSSELHSAEKCTVEFENIRCGKNSLSTDTTATSFEWGLVGVESNWNSFDSKICDSIDSKGQKIFEKFDEN